MINEEFVYDYITGANKFAFFLNGSADDVGFDLQKFIVRLYAPSADWLSCYDCAAAVQAFTSLVGSQAIFYDWDQHPTRMYGYIPISKLVGWDIWGQCNNPFWLKSDIEHSLIVGNDEVEIDTDNPPNNLKERSKFDTHGVCKVNGQFYDACVWDGSSNWPLLDRDMSTQAEVSVPKTIVSLFHSGNIVDNIDLLYVAP